ncbi:MAG TPA: kelch repeat-containing protein [Steroidobacter sp.]
MLALNHRAVAAIALFGLFLGGCGGGGGSTPAPSGPAISQFTSDRSGYYVGENARLTAVFANGAGVLQPDDIPVQSGQPVTISGLTQTIRYKLTVTSGTQSVSRDLDLNVSYRERTRAIDMPFARAEHAAVTLQDGRVIIFGGEDNGSVFPNSVWAFDPATERFSQISELATGRFGFIAVKLYDGDVLVAGGIRSLTGSPHAELIDGDTGAVSALPNAPQRDRVYAAASLLPNGAVLISGGQSGGNPDSTVEIYDPATDTFTLLPGTLHVGRAEHTSVRINDRRVLIYGGYTADGQPAPPELYDPVTATSTLLAAPETGVRARQVVHTMIDGGVLILGGMDADDQPIGSILRFDPASSAFSPFASMATPRASFAVGRLVDSRLLLVGGIHALVGGGTDATEVVGVDGGRRDGPAMTRGRFLHTVTALQSGKLLIVGGLDEARRAVASAEVFE